MQAANRRVAPLDPVARWGAMIDIQQLAFRYGAAFDTRDKDLLISLFYDTNTDLDPPTLGRREMQRFQYGPIRQTIHLVTNHLIEVLDTEHALGTVYCLCQFADGDQWCEQVLRYDDEYLRLGDQWLFRSRQHLVFCGAVQPINPMKLPPMNWPSSNIGKGVLPEAWPSWLAAVTSENHDEVGSGSQYLR